MSYNPFDKPIGATLNEADLQVLLTRQLSEGFFLEFKRELPPQREKIARSVASFANTYGGWYLVGVEGGPHNGVLSVCGFPPTGSNHDPVSVITEAIKVGVDPTPVFHAQVVTLTTGHLIVVVHVPGEQEAPFITKDGRIYRRTHDSSAPVAETSRHALDQLVLRGEKLRKAFDRFAQEPPPVDSRFPDENTRIAIYISPAPLGVVHRPELTSEESVASLLKRSREPLYLGDPFPNGMTGNVPMDTVLVRQQSISLSQVAKGAEAFGGISIQLDAAGRCAIRVPIYRMLEDVNEIKAIRSATCLEALRTLVQNSADRKDFPFSRLVFFNIGEIWLCALNLIAFYLDWLKPTPAIAGYDLAVEATAVHRCVPFYDHDRWGEHVKEYGLPVTLVPRSRVPEFSESPWGIWSDDRLWIHVCSMIGRAFGLPTELMAKLITPAVMDASERIHGKQQKQSGA